MGKPLHEVAEIFRGNLDKLGSLSPEQWKVVNALIRCRTARLGGHMYKCDCCGHTRIAYNSCRNRHCPKCQGRARARWVRERVAELLPVEYFHVVFTVPDVLHRLAVFNKELFYTLLFTAVKESLLEASANPKNLGGRIGFVAILHTWGQTLLVHPHIHCVVPGGGLSADGTRWIAAKKGFLVPVKVLAKLFRAKVLSSLKQAFQDNILHPSGEETAGASSETFQQLVDKAYSKHWMVYAKKPFAGPMQVLRYVGKYTHRVAISNWRIVDVRENSVAFKWRDYRDAGSMKTMTLSAAEFMRRYLLHVIPKGFVRIRFYGMLSNRNKKDMLALSRKVLNETQGKHEDCKGQNHDSEEGIMTDIADGECFLCPECRKGHMFIVMVIDPEPFVNTKEELDSS